MAISYEENLRKAKEAALMSYRAAAVQSEEIEEKPVAMFSLARSSDSWVVDEKYLWYDEFSDDQLSSVDSGKNITLADNQINLTQESNSQYIPFEMPRHYDGFDLSTTTLVVFFVNKKGYADFAAPINVRYSDEKIRFGWLVDKRATAVEGVLQFEIQAIGATSKGDEYVWKTKPSNAINILKSLAGNGVIEPDYSWTSGFITEITAQVDEAKKAAQQAQDAVGDVADYAKEAKTSADEARSVVDEAKQELEAAVSADVDEKVGIALANYYTSDKVDELIANIDISDQLDGVKEDLQGQIDSLDGLAAFDVEYDGSVMTFYNGKDAGTRTVMKEISINSDPTDEWTAAYTSAIEQKIADGDNAVKDELTPKITAQETALSEYKTATDADLSGIHEAIDGLPETLQEDYYNKDDSDAKFATKTALETTNTNVSSVTATANTNKDNITGIGTQLAEVQDILANVDTSPRKTYDVSYNDVDNPDVGENKFVLWEITDEGLESETREIKQKFEMAGGAGGTGAVLKIEYITTSPVVATVDDAIVIRYNFSGTDSSGDAIGDGVATWKVAGIAVATNTAVSGENEFDITKYIALGTQKVNLVIEDDAGNRTTKSWTVQKVDVRIESDFNDSFTYPIGEVSFNYTPYGAISKDVHFILDGEEIGSVTTSASGIPMGYTLPSQEHGAHLLEVYMTATINNNTIESNHIFKDILWYDAGRDVPVIGCIYQNFTARQYDTTNIVYTVHDPSTETPDVALAVDDVIVSELTLDNNTQTWQYKTVDVGEHTLTITCGDTVKEIKATIEKLDITIEPVTAGLVVDFNPVGKSNNDADRIWSNDTYKMTVSENFDWVNGGYQYDDNGDQYFCIKAGTRVDLDYPMFADDAKKNGKEMKLVFKTTNVQESNAQFLSCVDNTTGTDHIGIEMYVHEAFIYGSADKLNLKYSEDDIIEFEFNITKNTEKVPEICGYEDGVATRHLVYDGSFGFTQVYPKTITLGSDKCDLHIYRMKIYNTSLTDRGILNNFIADARSADEMVSRYNRNQIYNENQELTPQTLAEKCPWLRVYIVSAPYFTNKKSDKVPFTTIQQIYKNGDPILDNWICYDCSHSGQGTSSDNYGASARNLDYIMNKSQREAIEAYFILGDGVTRVKEISLTRTSVPVAYLNFKANVASSNHFTNALLAKRYNRFNPYKRPFVRADESIIPYIKDTMEFYNAVVFIQETDEDLSTHREFADTAVHFYSIGNIGDSKKTDDTRLTDPSDRYECINEICDVELPLSDWPNTEEAITALEAEKFDKSGSYEWRYIWEDGTDEENAEVREYCKQRWIEMYKFVVQSTDEEFKEHFSDYFVLDSVLYYYLFTTRYCMVDNRAKNSFWHYGKTGEVDVEGNPIRKWDLAFMYDCDSSMSLNNYGNSVYRHGYEDTDTMDGTNEEVFRESDSTFFCRVRDIFADELASMYNTLESQNAWHAESFLNEIETWQKQFPEELWRLDCQRKYIRSYSESFINGAGDPQFLKNMAQGRMLYPVKQWERSQEAYMASKYQSSVASSDNAVLRCTVPIGDLAVPVNYRLKLTPYDYMYLNVKYGTQEPIQVRATPGNTYEIPFDGSSVDIIDVYSASRIQDMGDLSSTYPATVDTAKASRLKELHIGNSLEGYDNPYLTTMTLGANYLLEVLNLENVSGLTQSLDLRELNNLRELYAHGTNTGGVEFASGGAIQVAELPAITAMSAKNLSYLTNLDVESYDKLTTLTVENCSTIDIVNIFEQAPNINRVRITGVDWILTDASLLERIYGVSGIDKNGYNVEQSVLAGKVHIPEIKQQRLYDYLEAWPDLEITYDSMVEQFVVTFKNDDGTELEVQYVDIGQDAVDPATREDNPITPSKESTVSHNYTFAGWDTSLMGVFADRTITATYTPELREYTIKYVAMNAVQQESTGKYGENVPYTGSIPMYTAGEDAAYTYYLFNRWDKSGYIDGDKVVNAIFDKFVYTESAFEGKTLSDMTPVELYALTKLRQKFGVVDGMDVGTQFVENIVSDGDKYSFTMGRDIDYDDIPSQTIVDNCIGFDGTSTVFDGTRGWDTGIKLFETDRDFTVAIDYTFNRGNTSGDVLAQCYQTNGSIGFKLGYNGSNVATTWSTSNNTLTQLGNREMLVIRHVAGSNNITVYNSALVNADISVFELVGTERKITNATLMFGAAKADDGVYSGHTAGTIHWCKIWEKDLGDDVCRDLALWTHEEIKLSVCGTRRYALSDNPAQMCTLTFLADRLLDRTMAWNSTSGNTGGWASSTLNARLNDRFYRALPLQMSLLIKQVKIPSSVGNGSTDVTHSGCYVSIPSLRELFPAGQSKTVNTDNAPYSSEGNTISYMSSNSARIRARSDGEAIDYWTRSPYAGSSGTYVFRVDAAGINQAFETTTTAHGILVMMSI